MNKENLSWLTTVPCSDYNFKSRLEDSDLETCREALKNKSISKTARKMIESRVKRLINKLIDEEENSYLNGGSEDSEGNLERGPVNFDRIRSALR